MTVENDKIVVEVDTDDAKRAYAKLGRAGEKSFEKQKTSAASLAKTLIGATTALGAVSAAYSFLSKSIRSAINASIEFERTTIKRAAALRNQGYEVQKTSRLLEQQASALETVTQISDETIRSAQAIAINFGIIPSKIDKYIRAAARMSDVTGMDLNQALQALMKAEQGVIDRTLRIIPGISDLTKEQLKAGDAVDFVNDAWRENIGLLGEGMTGKIKKLETAWANLGEAMVTAAANSKPLMDALTWITDQVDTLQRVSTLDEWIVGGLFGGLFGGISASDFMKGERAFEAAVAKAAQAELEFQKKQSEGIVLPGLTVNVPKGGKGDGDAAKRDKIAGSNAAQKLKVEADYQNGLAALRKNGLDYQIDLTNKMATEEERRAAAHKAALDQMRADEEDAQQAIKSAAIIGTQSLISSFATIERNRIDSWERQARAHASTEGEMAKITEEANRKRFEADKVSGVSQALLAGAVGVAQALASAPPPYNFVLGAIQAAVAAAQVAAVASQQYGGGGEVSVPSMPGGIAGGAAGAGGASAVPPPQQTIPQQNLRPINVTVIGDLSSQDVTRLRRAMERDLRMGIGA